MVYDRTHNKTVYELSRDAKELEKRTNLMLNDPKGIINLSN